VSIRMCERSYINMCKWSWRVQAMLVSSLSFSLLRLCPGQLINLGSYQLGGIKKVY
jgi:hypothetical protein